MSLPVDNQRAVRWNGKLTQVTAVRGGGAVWQHVTGGCPVVLRLRGAWHVQGRGCETSTVGRPPGRSCILSGTSVGVLEIGQVVHADGVGGCVKEIVLGTDIICGAIVTCRICDNESLRYQRA